MSTFEINDKDDYFIIEEHEIELLDGFDMEYAVGDTEGLERSEKHDEREMREKFINSVEKEKEKEISYSCDYTWDGNFCNSHRNTPLTTCINTNIKEIELKINTSTVEEVIFRKHKVEIINKDTRRIIMEGVVSGYSLVGRVYDPDIVLNFDDGRSFYNENFGYLMRFYM
jgi:hypothetical protein